MKLSLLVSLAAYVVVSADNDYDQYQDVEDMNEADGNFQYYDADGQYDESYTVSGYYDEYGQFVQYDSSYEEVEYVDEEEAQEYYENWQQNGGGNGYFDNDGDWVVNYYEDVPCESYVQQAAGQFDAADYNYDYNQDGVVDANDWNAYAAACEDSMRIRTDNCANSAIELDSLEIFCDSPYRTYFGNGHLSSQLCEYGDRATIIAYFTVKKNLSYLKNIYMTLGAYAGKDQKELLWAVRSVELCNTFVGHQCTKAGNYAFAFEVTFDYGAYSDYNLFVPQVEVGFSSRADEGYNLGGVNIDCKFNPFYRKYEPWHNGKSAHASQVWGAGGLGALGGRFGFLIGLLLAGGAAGYFVYSRKQSGIEFQGNADELIKTDDEA